MDFRVVNEPDVTPALDAAIRDGLIESFPADRDAFAAARPWHGSVPSYSIVAEEGNRVVAHAGVVDRTITVGGRPLRVAGVQNVFVRPTHRGTGLSDRVMWLSTDEARRRGFDAGLLFCVPKLVPVYARTGWQSLGERDVTRIDETGQEAPIPGKNETMFFPLKLATFPHGRIHLRGNDW
jgi:predicted N-acetyltransferase YhbS